MSDDWNARRESHFAAVERLDRERKEVAAKDQAQRDKARPAAMCIEQAIGRKRRMFAMLEKVTRPGAPSITLRLVGEVTPALCNRLGSELRRNPHASRVVVVIDSPGGSAVDAEKLFLDLVAHRASVETIARGTVASAAATIFAAGDSRRAPADARFLLHHAAYVPTAKERLTSKVLASRQKVVRQADDMQIAMLASRCGQSHATIEAALKEQFLSAAQARDIGLVTDVDLTSEQAKLFEREAVAGAVERAQASHAARRRRPPLAEIPQDLLDTFERCTVRARRVTTVNRLPPIEE